MENKRFVVPALILSAAVAVVVLIAKKPEIEEAPTLISVRTSSVSPDKPKQTMVLAGTTRSAETTLLRFQVGGRVDSKSVKLGDKLKKGAVIAKIYNPELEPLKDAATNNLARLTAEAEQAQRDLLRIEQLYSQQAVTEQEWETAKTRLSATNNAKLTAQAELERATQLAKELVLTAPFDGSITEILIDVGEVVQGGAPAVRISNSNAVELKLAMGDSILRQLALGQEVSVRSTLDPALPSSMGVISELSPYREPGSLPEVIISLDSREISPGVPVNAEIQVEAIRGIGLPLRSVLMTGQDTVAVYRVEEGVAKLVPIRPVSISTTSVVIEDGLNAGDDIVIEGLSQLYDGASVVEASGTTYNEAE